ncbi:uncharacterized protein TNCV_3926791 [Trichonephila clavipes]|nr:uncharacterized protein TNCV_3926791 [Trichonephila clavipes]
MDEDRTTNKVFNAQLISVRRKGRPNFRWVYGLEKDLLVLRTKKWRILAGRRLTWERLLEKLKTHLGLSSHRGRKNRKGRLKKGTLEPQDNKSLPPLKKSIFEKFVGTLESDQAAKSTRKSWVNIQDTWKEGAENF